MVTSAAVMPPRKTPQLDARFQFRLTTKEKEEVFVQAGLAGISASAYLRSRVLGRPVIADTDMNTLRELRRQGGLVKLLHTESGGAYSAETAAALRDLQLAIRALAKKLQT